jgi:hypothetical protein
MPLASAPVPVAMLLLPLPPLPLRPPAANAVGDHSSNIANGNAAKKKLDPGFRGGDASGWLRNHDSA